MKNISRQVILGLLMTFGLCAIAAADGAKSKADPGKLTMGAAVYEQWCAPCHADGTHYSGTVALQAKYNGAIPAVLMKRTDLTPESIAHFVRNGFSLMPFFRKTEINDQELAALAAYLTQPKK